jgi:hypothetical protein
MISLASKFSLLPVVMLELEKVPQAVATLTHRPLNHRGVALLVKVAMAWEYFASSNLTTAHFRLHSSGTLCSLADVG